MLKKVEIQSGTRDMSVPSSAADNLVTSKGVLIRIRMHKKPAAATTVIRISESQNLSMRIVAGSESAGWAQ